MADPFTAFFAWLGSTIGGTIGANLIMYATQLATVALTVSTVAIGNHQRRKAKQKALDAYNASLQDRLVMVATADGARSRVYGRVRNCDGVLFKATRGTNSEFYTLIVALAGHEIDAVESIYFGDQLVTLDGSGYVQTAPWATTEQLSAVASMTVSGGSGSVSLPYTPVSGSVLVSSSYAGTGGDSGGDYVQLTPTVVGTQVSVTGFPLDGTATVSYQYLSAARSYARVRSYLGTAAQDISADLVADFPDLCTTSDKFRGIALLRIDLEYSQDAFPTGVPQVSAVIRGAKCYDPRSALTVWTQNPAVIARDWCRYAYGGNTTSVSDAAIVTAANACDVDTSFTSPAGTVVMDTYQCGIVGKLDTDPTAVLSEVVESMAGRWGWAGGVLKIVAGSYRAPVAAVTEDWVTNASEVMITPSPPRSDLVNSYRPTIANRDNKYQAEPAPPLIASSYVTADGEELSAEITMAGVTSVQHAQHVSGVLLRDARQSLVVQLPCNMRAWKLELFDTVTVTIERFGWSSKVFEVMGWRASLPGGVVLTLKEANATVYNADAGFADLGNEDNSDLPEVWGVAQVTGLTITSGTVTLVDNSVLTRTLVQWTAMADAAVLQSGHIEVQYSESSGVGMEAWPSLLEAGSATQTVIAGLRANRVYVFRVRAINAAGVRGRWSLQKAHVVAMPPAIEGTNTYLQASAPTGASDGDLWYDSDDGNKPYRYNLGTLSWVAIQDGNIADAYAAIANISSDNVLSKGEKPQLIIDWQSAANEYSTLIASANAFSIVAERDNYSTYYSVLGAYLGGLSPAYNDSTQDTTIVGSTYRTHWQNHYYYRQVLLNKVAQAAGQTATWANVTGTGKPADFATQNVVQYATSFSGTPVNGDVWVDTSVTPNVTRVRVGGVWQIGANYSTNTNQLTDGANLGLTASWTGVTSRPTLYRVAAAGYSATANPVAAGFYNGETGATLYASGNMYRVLSINRSTGAITNYGAFDPLNGGVTAANAMAAALNAIISTHIAVVYTYDEPSGNRLLGNLPAAMYRCGASRAVFGSSLFQYRGAYILVGIGGCGEGNGFEAYGGETSADADAWCDASFYIYNGNLVISGTTKTPGALADYGYTGSLVAVTTFIQASTPSATAIGDLWFDSDDGYKLYRAGAVGTGNWTAYQLGTPAIAPEAATKTQHWDVASASGNDFVTSALTAFGVNCKVLVTVSFQASYTNTSSGQKTGAIRVRVGSSGAPLYQANGTTGLKFFQLTTASPTNEMRFTVMCEFDYQAAWGAAEFAVFHQLTGAGSGGVASSLNDIQVKVEALKL